MTQSISEELWTEEFEERLYKAVENRFGESAREFLEENADSQHGSYREPIYVEAESRGILVEDLYRQEMINSVLEDFEENFFQYSTLLDRS